MNDGTYIRNLETGKLELHFSRADYLALPHDVKSDIKRYFRFSRAASCWTSKAKAPNLHYPESIAKRAGLTDGGEEGERLSFAEQVEAKQARAERRAERYEAKADKTRRAADSSLDEGNRMFDAIPLGQPMLVDHYSYGRDKRYRERASNKIRKGLDLAKTAKHYERKAAAAETTASGYQLENPAFLARRIEEQEIALRKVERAKANHAAKDPAAPGWNHAEDRRYTTDEWTALLDDWADNIERTETAVRDKLDFYREKLERTGADFYDQDQVKARAADAKTNGETLEIQYRGTWYPFVRANPKSVTVGNWFGNGYGQWKVNYPNIKGIRTAAPADLVPPSEATMSRADFDTLKKAQRSLAGRVTKRLDGTPTADVTLGGHIAGRRVRVDLTKEPDARPRVTLEPYERTILGQTDTYYRAVLPAQQTLNLS